MTTVYLVEHIQSNMLWKNSGCCNGHKCFTDVLGQAKMFGSIEEALDVLMGCPDEFRESVKVVPYRLADTIAKRL